MQLKHIKPLSLWTIAALMISFIACSNTVKEEEETTGQPAVAGTTPYTWNQQLFCLNMLSNISARFQTSKSIDSLTVWAVDSVLKDQAVQKYLGTWNLVWGPAVYHGKSDTPANTMFIARQGNSDNYVVAIAGTDPASMIAAIWEDADVANKVKWPYGPDTAGSISQGTFNGFKILRDTLKGKDRLGAREFLALMARDKAINIYVTGHSLGGFLSPAYALFLNDTRKDWLGSKANIYCLAVAGATPGDSAFSKYYNTQLGKNTTRVWNKLDVVPHAYEASMLKQVSDLYMPQDTIPKTLQLKNKKVITKDLLFALETNAALKKYCQLYPGTIVGFTSDMYDTPKASDYMTQMLAQHIPAYATFFGVDSFQADVQRIVGLSNPFFAQGYPWTGISSYDTSGKNFNKINP